MLKVPTDELIKQAIEDGWTEEQARCGYAIFTSNFGNGTEHIEMINSLNLFESDKEAAGQAEKDGIKIIRNLKFKDPYDIAYYIDTPENREKLAPLIEHGISDDVVALEINLYASGYYSGAEYNESIMILKDDFIKLFSAYGVTPDTLKSLSVYCGELDGKHSEVYGDVGVEFWTKSDLDNMDDCTFNNSGDHLLNALVYDSNNELYGEIKSNITCDKVKDAEKRFLEYHKETKKYKKLYMSIPKDKYDLVVRVVKAIIEEN